MALLRPGCPGPVSGGSGTCPSRARHGTRGLSRSGSPASRKNALHPLERKERRISSNSHSMNVRAVIREEEAPAIQGHSRCKRKCAFLGFNDQNGLRKGDETHSCLRSISQVFEQVTKSRSMTASHRSLKLRKSKVCLEDFSDRERAV